MRGPTKALTGKILVVRYSCKWWLLTRDGHTWKFSGLYTGNLTAGEYFWFSFPFVSCESSKGSCSWKRKIFSGQP